MKKDNESEAPCYKCLGEGKVWEEEIEDVLECSVCQGEGQTNTSTNKAFVKATLSDINL